MERKNCISCQKDNNKTALYCSNCGSKFENDNINKTTKQSVISNNSDQSISNNLEEKINSNETANNSEKQLYCCWIGNITTKYSIEQLEKHFNDEAARQNFLPIHSICINLNQKYNKNQCFMNFYSDKTCGDAVNFFHNAVFDEDKLTSRKMYKPLDEKKKITEMPPVKTPLTSTVNISKRRNSSVNAKIPSDFTEKNEINNKTKNKFPENHEPVLICDNDIVDDDFNYSSDDKSDTNSIASDIQSLSGSKTRKFCVYQSKLLEKQLKEKIELLKNVYKSLKIEVEPSKKNKYDIMCKITSEEQETLDRVFKIIKQWKVLKFKLNLKERVINSLIKKKPEFLKKSKTNETFISINIKKREVIILSFKKESLDESTRLTRKFINNLNSNENIPLENKTKYYLVKNALQDKSFIKKNKLDKLKFEFKDPIPSRNLGGLIIANGNEFAFENINLKRKIETLLIQEILNCDKKNTRLVLTKLNAIKKELEKKFINLHFHIKDNLIHLEICGFNEDETKYHFEKIQNFLKNIKSVIIDLKKNHNIDLNKVKELIDEYKKNDIDKDENDILNEVDIYFKEDSKIIYINGTDSDEINEIKADLTKRINGSKEITKIIKIKNEIYTNYLIKNETFFNNLKRDNQNVKIFNNLKFKPLIRINGPINEVNKVSSEIEKFKDDFSKNVFILDHKFKKAEYEYILNQKHEIDKFMNQTNTIINIEDFKSYLTVKIPNTNIKIELLKGDLTKIHADAYVNPANTKLKHNDGLAKAIIEEAGEYIQTYCDNHVKRNGDLNEGCIFTSQSGNMGVKMNSIIIHAVGPIWKGGNYNEETILNNVVKQILIEAENNNCNSIVIPAISIGIFQYPIEKALENISQSIIEYLSNRQIKSLKNIILINDDDSIIHDWETILRYLTLNKNYICEPIKKIQLNKSKWYWKDDDGNWKAYLSELNDFIASKNSEYMKSKSPALSIFDINMNEKSYKINLVNKKQINIKTGYVHEITNEVPTVVKYQWSWLNDRNQKSPYSLTDSEIIEKANINRREFVDLQTKRHDNDNGESYRIFFSNNNNARRYLIENKITGDGIQQNTRTNYIRPIHREEVIERANIANDCDDDENEHDENKSQLIFFSGLEINIKEANMLLQNFLEKAYIEEDIKFIDISVISDLEIKELENKYDAQIKKNIDKNTILIKGLPDSINKIKTKFLELSITQQSKVNYPTHWEKMNASEKLKLISIPITGQEYKNIYDEVSKTIPNPEIIKIERIQNKWLWKLYCKQTEILKDKGVNINEKWLFHGTRNTEPIKVYDDEIGFDMRYSSSGMWGIGIYFAVNASYSKSGYVFRNSNDGTHSMFYARVALGNDIQLPPNSSLRMPPVKSGNSKYDSIKGNTGGSDIYIIYENSRAYPDYLITFKN